MNNNHNNSAFHDYICNSEKCRCFSGIGNGNGTRIQGMCTTHWNILIFTGKEKRMCIRA